MDVARVPKLVTPDNAEGFNMTLAEIFGIGPKWAITCGTCHGSFKKRLPLVDYPGIACPYCGIINKLNLTWDERRKR